LLLARALGLICSKDSRCQLDARFFAVQPLIFLNSLPAPSVGKTLEVGTDIFGFQILICQIRSQIRVNKYRRDFFSQHSMTGTTFQVQFSSQSQLQYFL